jgi:hypothetical protein
MINYGGEIKIYSVVAFTSLRDVIDEMIIFNKKHSYFANDEILNFCKFSSNKTKLVYTNLFISVFISTNDYDEFYSVEDELYGLSVTQDFQLKEKIVFANQKIVLKIRAKNIMAYRLSLLFSVILANKVEGIVDLIAYPINQIHIEKNKYICKEWEKEICNFISLTETGPA